MKYRINYSYHVHWTNAFTKLSLQTSKKAEI